MYDLFAEEERAHHGHVGEREQKRAQYGKTHGLGHGAEHTAFDAGERQYGQVYDEDDDFPERRRTAYFAGGGVYFLVHLLLVEAGEFAEAEVVHGGFHYDHGPVYDQPEVNGAKAHQVAGYAEELHENDRKQHGQRDHGGHYQPRAQVTEEE